MAFESAISSVMSSQEKAEAARWVDLENKRLAQMYNRGNAQSNQNLGKDDFLKILLTQLAHQDPTAPMQDKEFIAQMAQFSSLEQMTNIAADFAKMARMLRGTEAAASLGKTVEIATQGANFENERVQGVVRAVTRDEMPQVLVNGRFYGWDQVIALYEEN